jgi:cell wall-associated NlpC family hydrolase
VPRASSPRGPRSGGRTVPARGTRTVDTRRAASAAEIADRTIGLGERYIGTPYVWGGESPAGFDCSGFVQYVYRRQGIELPRVSRDQARAGRALPTSLDGIARGDLLFFAGDGRTVSHVAIYAGDGRILHSSSSGRGVRYDDLGGGRGGWYVRHLVGVRRVIEDGYLPWPETYAAADGDDTMPARAMPLDEAFDALVGDRGDEGAPAAQ